MAQFMAKVRDVVACGIVGGSDIKKITEQMGGLEGKLQWIKLQIIILEVKATFKIIASLFEMQIISKCRAAFLNNVAMNYLLHNDVECNLSITTWVMYLHYHAVNEDTESNTLVCFWAG